MQQIANLMEAERAHGALQDERRGEDSSHSSDDDSDYTDDVSRFWTSRGRTDCSPTKSPLSLSDNVLRRLEKSAANTW